MRNPTCFQVLIVAWRSADRLLKASFCCAPLVCLTGRVGLLWLLESWSQPHLMLCSLDIPALLSPPDLSPAPGFNYSDSASFPRGWQMQYAWECLCYRQPWGRSRCCSAPNWSILGGRDPQMSLCSSCRAVEPWCPGWAVWPCHAQQADAHIVLHTWSKVLVFSLEHQTRASEPCWHKMHSCSSWTRQELAALCPEKFP